MFTLANNKEIGQYLISHIDKQFKSRGNFAKHVLLPTGNQQITNRYAICQIDYHRF